MAAGAQLRPLSLGEILDVSIKIYFRHASTLFRIVAVIVVPVQILGAIVFASALPEPDTGFNANPLVPVGETEAATAEIWTLVAGSLVVWLLTFLGNVLATAASFRAVGTAYLGQRPEWVESLRFAGRRLHHILWATLLAGLVTLAGLIACIIPGIWLAVSYTFVVPALLMEGTRGGKALSRSFNLVSGTWWRIAGILLLANIMAGIVAQVVSGVFTALVFTGVGDSTVGFLTLNALSQIASSLITTPFSAAIVTVLYFDLRVRKEAFDLELLARGLGVEPPAGAPLLPPAPPSYSPGAAPPFWPPPPGWSPGPVAYPPPPPPLRPAGAPPPPPPPSLPAPPPPDQPPYWPPPPGWRSGGEPTPE